MDLDSDTTLSAEEFVELLIEIDALQRLYDTWTTEECEQELPEEEHPVRMSVLDGLLCRKLALRDKALAEFRAIYPELDQFEWAKPEYDA
jgi:hypothetical protein